MTHVDGLPIRARFFWQKRKVFDGVADDIRDYHFNGTAYYFSLPEYFIVCYSTSTTPTLTMLPLPKPTDFAVDFPTVARSVAFGIVFREFTTTLNPYGDTYGI